MCNKPSTKKLAASILFLLAMATQPSMSMMKESNEQHPHSSNHLSGAQTERGMLERKDSLASHKGPEKTTKKRA